ncbi:MAG: terpene cyclase/mutase family protein [Actinomycetota bacterium]|nr:terpene cyclase/mutase family protein [Actinomycetota bacterium]
MPSRSPELPPPRRARLSDSLAVVSPSLPPEVVSPERVAMLTALATALPPARAAGFECSLAAGNLHVDLQLGVSARDGEPAALAHFLHRNHIGGPEWDRVGRLCEDWGAPGNPLHDAISELWLEFDAPDVSDGRPPRLDGLIPSIFAALRPRETAAALAAAHQVLRSLVQPAQAETLALVLDRCSASCPPPAHVSHVGVMLGRPIPALRIHVSHLPLDAFKSFLTTIGWAGDAPQVHSLAELLLLHGDLVVLCLDVVGDLLPRAGLECFFAQKHGVDPRWAPLLGRLVALGLATAEKTDALLRWPGSITPPEATAEWPDDLIVASLLRPVNVFGVIDRRLSHVKLSWAATAPVSAKAYFGFGHLWTGTSTGDDTRGAPVVAALPRSTTPSPALEDSIGAAIGRLLAARNQGGWWRDFFDRGRPGHVERRVMGYASDEWVTAYVAAVLATVADARARAAAEHAFGLLLARRGGNAGWGYHALLPPDADTTTWVLRLAHQLGAPPSERLAAARRFVAGLIGPEGGVRTYEDDAARQLSQFLRMEGSYQGWCATHTCVTAAAAVLDLSPRLLAFLGRTQRVDGSWSGHWWDDDEYTTARAAEALAGHEKYRAAAARARTWAAGRISTDGGVSSPAHGGPSAFATSLAVQAALAGAPWGVTLASSRPALNTAEGDAVGRATRWLLSQQRSDGSWAPSARLRVPAPAMVNPLASPETTLTYVDDDALFTTATALAALSAVAAWRAGGAA